MRVVSTCLVGEPFAMTVLQQMSVGACSRDQPWLSGWRGPLQHF